jgi:hypothetical protein
VKLLLENWRKYLDDERLNESIGDMLQNVDDLLDQTIQEAAPEIVRNIREREVDEDVDEFIDGAIHGGWEAKTSTYADPPNIGEPVRIMDAGDKEEVTEMYRLGYEWGWNNPDKASEDIPPDVKRQMVEEAIGEFQERISEEVLIDALEKSVDWAKHSLDDVHTILKKAKDKFGWKLVPAIAGIEVFEHAVLPALLVMLTGNPAFYAVSAIPTLEILAATALAIAKSKLPKKPEPEPEPGHLDWYEDEGYEANLFESWRKYQLLTEAEDIYALYESQVITEAEYADRIKKWAKRKGIPLAVALSLATGAAASPAAYAQDAPVDDTPVQVDQAKESESLTDANGVSNWGILGSRIQKKDKEEGSDSSKSWKTDYVFFVFPHTGYVTAYPADAEVPKNLEPASPTAVDLNYHMIFGSTGYFK